MAYVTLVAMLALVQFVYFGFAVGRARSRHDVEALAVCTVSDDIVTGDALSSDERQTTFDEMILVALETVVA